MAGSHLNCACREYARPVSHIPERVQEYQVLSVFNSLRSLGQTLSSGQHGASLSQTWHTYQCMGVARHTVVGLNALCSGSPGTHETRGQPYRTNLGRQICPRVHWCSWFRKWEAKEGPHQEEAWSPTEDKSKQSVPGDHAGHLIGLEHWAHTVCSTLACSGTFKQGHMCSCAYGHILDKISSVQPSSLTLVYSTQWGACYLKARSPELVQRHWGPAVSCHKWGNLWA